MKIILYQFSKKSNSTARPINTTPSLELDNAQIKSPSSVNEPLLQLAKGTITPTYYNYVYIPDFNRYYFINDITYNIGVWLISCNVDVLASFKEDITASSQYVLRSSSNYNANIMDNFYTSRSVIHKSSNNLGDVYRTGIATAISGYFSKSYTAGYFMLGIINGNSDGSGITYYFLGYSAFMSFISNLLSYTPSDISDVSSGLAKAVWNPIEYITICKWYPIAAYTTTVTSSIDVCGYNISFTGVGGVVSDARCEEYYSDVTIPKHYQLDTYRKYLQLYPWSQYKLYFEPFGFISIDNTLIYNASTMRLKWLVDYATGTAMLSIFNKDTGTLIETINAQYGVDIPVTQLSIDYVGMGAGLGGAFGSVGQALQGDIGGAINSLISGVGSVWGSIAPSHTTIGAQGSFIPYKAGTPYLQLISIEQVDTNATKWGYPYCANATLSTLSGYCLCSNATVSYTTHNPLSMEADTVNNLLNTGVYLE